MGIVLMNFSSLTGWQQSIIFFFDYFLDFIRSFISQSAAMVESQITIIFPMQYYIDYVKVYQ